MPADAAQHSPQAPRTTWVFNACQLGVVLRAVLCVQIALAVGAAFHSADGLAWLTHLALLTAAALPATAAWLLLCCALRRGPLAPRAPSVPWQYALVIALGAAAGGLASAVWVLVSLGQAAYVASSVAGALLAALVLAAWVMRSKGSAPAETAARLAQLQSRIRPHFLFNTLNTAIALVRANPRQAQTLLEDLSDLFRHALLDHGAQGAAVTLGEEIALAKRYLAIEQLRFGPRLQVQWDVDARADAARVPALLLQPLVENAVRHGVEPSETGACVHITTQCRGGMVQLRLRNPVPAGQGVQGAGLALRNVRERLLLMHDVQAQFDSGMRDGLFEVRMEFAL